MLKKISTMYSQKFNTINVNHKDFDYDWWFAEEELDNKILNGEEQELKEEKRIKILTPNKLLIRLPVLLAEIKAGNSRFTKKWIQTSIIHFLSAQWNHKKPLQQFNQGLIIMGVHIGDKKLVIITEGKTIHLILTKKTDNSLKHETDSTLRHKRILVEERTKN